MTERGTPSKRPPGLQTPLALELRDPVLESQVLRMWHRIEERRSSARTTARSFLLWAAMGALLGVSLMLAVEAVRAPSRKAPVAERARTAAPLLLRTGLPIEMVEVAPTAPARGVELSDGSRLQVDPGARLEPLVSSATDVVFRLALGRVVFDVVPGGPRRWVVEAGIARVEIVGTRFAVLRAVDHVRVDVERGVVLVRGATVPDGVGRVEAGRFLEVRAPIASEERPEAPASDNARGQTSQRSTAASTPWRASAKSGHYDEAYAALGTGGVGREAAQADSVEELLALADVARLSGHAAEGVEPLERILREHAASPSAPLAGVTLGRIELGLNRPAEAARAFERALALHVPGGLEEDVYARLVEAYSRAGDRAAAAATARDYGRRFPGGRRSADVLRWTRE